MTIRWIHRASAVALLGGAGLVLYLSWVGQPQMTRIAWIPRWIAAWADREGTLRTGVPFVFLGLFLSRGVIVYHDHVRGWLTALATLVVLVAFAEIGQLWLPLRVPSIVDVAWGAAGSAVGLAAGWAIGKLVSQGRRTRRISIGSHGG